MNTFPSGEPLSGWHWICPCGFSLHSHKDETDFMLREAREHRRWHVTSLNEAFERIDSLRRGRDEQG